jgi:hypothetical protein
LVLATDNEGMTVFNVAAESMELEGFQGIFNWAKEDLTTEEENNFF